MPNFPRSPSFQDGVDDLSASTFNDLESRAAAAIAASVVTIVGPTQPVAPNPPSGTEYVWFKTDGQGNLQDILSGVA